MGQSNSRIVINITKYALIIIILLWILVPIFWMILTALKSQSAMYTLPPKWIFKPTLSNFKHTWEMGISKYLWNSLIASSSAVAIATLLGSLAGYSLTRGKIPRRNDIAFWVLTTRMAPIIAVLLPLYIIFRNLHLLNTLLGLVVAYTTFDLPLAVWIMASFFKTIPRELEEAALIDGCGKLSSFLRISLPLSAPGLVATAVLCFIFAWNDYAFAVILTTSDTQTLPVFAARLITHRGIQWGIIFSMGTMIFIPVLIAGWMIRKYLVRGLTMGAIK